MKKSELKKRLVEALTPDEAAKVEPKYKETYAAMIRGKGPLKLKKYDNPDKVVRGRVINNLKESTRRTNEKLDVAIKEVFSEKQRKYMCVMAQPGSKRPKGLSKADAKEMCADTKLSKAKQEEQALEEIDNLMNETGQEIAKKNMDMYKDKNRLEELVKAALMGPMNENRYDINDPNSPMGKLNDEYESSGLKSIVDKYGLDVVLMILSSGEYGDRLNETSTDKYDDNPALKGKQSELPDGLQKSIIKKKGGKVDENLPKNTSIDNAKELKLNKTTEDIRGVIAKMSDAYMALGKELQSNTNPKVGRYMNAMAGEIKDLKRMLKGMTNESFKSLSKKIDKQKGKSKKDADNIAGYIANIKRKGGGKGPTAKQKKRMAETILKELRG
jgi:hypothetical protein